jgi:hypothetical protein
MRNRLPNAWLLQRGGGSNVNKKGMNTTTTITSRSLLLYVSSYVDHVSSK